VTTKTTTYSHGLVDHAASGISDLVGGYRPSGRGKPKRTVTFKSREVAVPYQATGARLGRGTGSGALSGLTLSQDAVDFRDLGDVAYIAQIDALSVTWRRNNLSEPDELTCVIHADALGGIDLRLVRAIQIDAWLFIDGDMANRSRGGAGYFGGTVTSISQNRFDNTIELECRDYTHLLQTTELNGSQGAAIDLNQPLVSVVDDLVRSVPGGDRWSVVDASATWAEGTQTLDPRRLDAQRLLGKIAEESGKLGTLDGAVAADDQQATIDALEAELADVQADFSVGVGQTIIGQYITHAQWGFTQGGGRMSVWSAVLKICALAGAVPEFEISEDGTPTVYLVDSAVLQAGNEGVQFRQFIRRDPDGTERFHRRLTMGVDIWEMEEERRLETEVRLDRVDVVAYSPDTGVVMKGSYGTPGRKKSGAETVETITAHGITSQEQLDLLAESAYRSRVGQEYALTLRTEAPWTTGGGTEDGPPDAPEGRSQVTADGAISTAGSRFSNLNTHPATSADLLYCAAGVPIEITFPGFEQRNMGGKTLAQDAELEVRARLGGSSLPWVEPAARAIAQAMSRARLNALFQVRSVEHEFDGEGDGSYSCTLELQGFLEDEAAESSERPRVLRDPTSITLLDEGLSLGGE
jgi:hypothetical protein